MVKNNKYIKVDKSLVFLIVVFVALFFLKAFFYNILGNEFFLWLEKVFNFIPGKILYYAFLPIAYIFLLPMYLVLNNLPFLNPGNNRFIAFSMDIAITIIYLTILFFLVKSIFHYFKKRYLMIGVVVLASFIILGLTSYYLIQKQSQLSSFLTLPATTLTETVNSTSDWKTYTNNSYHLEFKYPQNYSFNENSDKIEIISPLSVCNPPLVFNIEEYKQMREVQIIIKKRYGSLEKILAADEGGKNYGWESKSFNEKPSFSIAVGAEMITPYTRFLVESYPGEVLDIQAYIFASGDQGKCIPKLDIVSASNVSKQILSTFKFLDSSSNTTSNTGNYDTAIKILQAVPEVQIIENAVIKNGRKTFFMQGDAKGDVVKIWLYEGGFPDQHTTRIDTFNVNVKSLVITVDDVAMISGQEFITLDKWKVTVKERFK